MPDLHDWITQRVNEVEQRVDRWHDTECDVHATTLIDAVVLQAATLCDCGGPAAVLRRVEADRRILARHTLDPDCYYEPACKGCGTYGDQEMAYTDNLNECPELLDLAHAHGLTPEILAGLDQPVPPPMPEQPEPRAFRIGPPARPTSSVPTALRGPNWKAQP